MFTKRLLAVLLVIPFLTSMPVLEQDKPALAYEIIISQPIDRRAEVLDAYFAKYNSPLRFQAQNFIDAADQNNLDWKLLPAIAGVESTFGKRIPGGYNAWGWGVYGDQAIYFDSWRDGIFTVAEGLRKNYLSRGLNDPHSINKMYSTSASWGKNVNFFINDLTAFERHYQEREPLRQPSSILPKTAGQSGVLAMNIN